MNYVIEFDRLIVTIINKNNILSDSFSNKYIVIY